MRLEQIAQEAKLSVWQRLTGVELDDVIYQKQLEKLPELLNLKEELAYFLDEHVDRGFDVLAEDVWNSLGLPFDESYLQKGSDPYKKITLNSFNFIEMTDVAYGAKSMVDLVKDIPIKSEPNNVKPDNRIRPRYGCIREVGCLFLLAAIPSSAIVGSAVMLERWLRDESNLTGVIQKSEYHVPTVHATVISEQRDEWNCDIDVDYGGVQYTLDEQPQECGLLYPGAEIMITNPAEGQPRLAGIPMEGEDES